jgi:hypothetical protein
MATAACVLFFFSAFGNFTSKTHNSYAKKTLLPIQAVARKLDIPEKYFEQ